jgi:hypothetical protein
MNLLFSKHITYNSFESVEIVRSKLEEVIKRKWNNFDNNLRGCQKEDGSFVLTQKWSFTSLSPSFWADAYVIVKLEEKENETILKVVYKPNAGLLILFYSAIVWLIYELITIDLSGTSDLKIFMLLIFVSIIFTFIKLPAFALRRSFERFLRL